MSNPLKKSFSVRQYLIAIVTSIILLCLIVNTIFYALGNSSETVATISKSRVKDAASQEEIAKELTKAWMGKYRIGSVGLADWIWTYEITKVEFWDPTSGCVNIGINVVTVLPSNMTKWMGLYAEKDGLWVKNGYTMILLEHENYYELRGPYSLC